MLFIPEFGLLSRCPGVPEIGTPGHWDTEENKIFNYESNSYD